MNKVSKLLTTAADKLTQKPGCGCAARQRAMNSVVPGSGDATKSVASALSRGLRKAARAVGGPTAENVEAPYVRRPGSQVYTRESLAQTPKSSPWTGMVPPDIPPDFEVVDSCNKAVLLKNSIDGKLVLWSTDEDRYGRYHGFPAGMSDKALEKLSQRCR